MRSIQLLLITLMVLSAQISESLAQTLSNDSTLSSDTIEVEKIKVHSPAKASLFSTVVPGLGQAYNKKYWKLPIVYGLIGGTFYLGLSNHQQFTKFKTAYGLRIDGDKNTIDEYDGLLSEAALEANVDFYQRNRDLSYIFVGLFYIFNIVDAAVDAHLFYFPKNDKLSFNLQPNIELTNNNDLSKGFKLVINL